MNALLGLPLGIYLSFGSAFLAILAGFYVYTSLNKESKIFLLYQVISILVSFGMMYLALIRRTNNLWLMHLFTPVQFGFLMWVFASWQERPYVMRLFQSLIPAFVLVWAIAAIFFEHSNEFNTFSRPTESILLIIASGYTLFQVNKEKVESLFRQPSFWIASGTLIYFTGMVILFTVTNFLLRSSEETLRTIWILNWTMNVVANVLYIGAFLCQKSRA